MNTHYVDLGGHIGNVTVKLLKLNEEAKEEDVTLIPDLSVAPGMTNILAGYGASKLDEVHSLRLFIGGIPRHPKPPLQYCHLFSLEGVFDHYTDPSYIIRNGDKHRVASLSEIERIDFDNFSKLEAFHTSGGTSTLLQTFRHVHTLEYKTIRYAGHAEKFQLFVDLKLTERSHYVNVNGAQVNPREVLIKVLESIVELGDKEDVVLVRVIVVGAYGEKPVTLTYETVVYKDLMNNITAMARTTATTISIVAQMIANETITKRGVLPPEKIVPGKAY